MLINNAVRTLLSGYSTATAWSGVHWSLTDPGLVVPLAPLVHLARLLAGGVLLPTGCLLLPQLDAGRPQVHHELRHPPHRHPGDDGLRQLQARVLEARQTELQAGLVAAR